MYPNKRLILAGMAAAAFIGPFTQTVYIPSLVELGQDFAVGMTLANLTLSLFVGILAVSGFIVGPLIDRYGRRRLLLPGLGLFILGSLLCLFAVDYPVFLAARGLQALGVSIALAVAAAVIADIYPVRERAAALSLYQFMAYLGPVLGPVAGGLIAHSLSWQWAFALLAGLGLLTLLYNARVLPETLPAGQAPAPSSTRALGDIFSTASATAIMLIAFSQFYGYYSFLVFLPQLLDTRFDLGVAARGFAFVPLTAGLLFGTLGARVWPKRVPAQRQVVLAAYLIAADVLILWGLMITGQLSFARLSLLLLIYGAALGSSLPAQTLLLVNGFTYSRATVIGTFNSVRFGGAALGPLLGVWIVQRFGLSWAFLAMGVLLLAASLLAQRQFCGPLGAARP